MFKKIIKLNLLSINVIYDDNINIANSSQDSITRSENLNPFHWEVLDFQKKYKIKLRKMRHMNLLQTKYQGLVLKS